MARHGANGWHATRSCTQLLATADPPVRATLPGTTDTCCLLCTHPRVCHHPSQVKETTRAVTFLHNELFFAAAQKKYVYIYDKRGLEVHCLREHTEPAALEFLPHHFLLASVGEPGEPWASG